MSEVRLVDEVDPSRSRKCFVQNNSDVMEIFSYGVIGEGDLFSMYSRPGEGGGGREGGTDFFSFFFFFFSLDQFGLPLHPTVKNEGSLTHFLTSLRSML